MLTQLTIPAISLTAAARTVTIMVCWMSVKDLRTLRQMTKAVAETRVVLVQLTAMTTIPVLRIPVREEYV